VSRSSALASKATGYPIARVASKIAIGLRLDEIPNAVTKKTLACFEPALDYIIVKIPRWPFDKFSLADRRITTQMKATGEVMAIDRTFEGALLKAIRSLEIGQTGLRPKRGDALSEMEIESGLSSATDERLFLIGEAFHRGMGVSEVAALSGVDPWFLTKIQRLVAREDALRASSPRFTPVKTPDDDALTMIRDARKLGFSSRHLSDLLGVKEAQVRAWCADMGLAPSYKMVDTCAAEFEAATPYFYSCWEAEGEA